MRKRCGTPQPYKHYTFQEMILSNIEKKITISGENYFGRDFQKLPIEEQIDKMREWFHENYEDPVVRTPYESAEGGYIYIWGGPYDANEELEIFGSFVESDIIEKLADELSEDCPDWTKKESPEDYRNSYLDFFISDNKYFETFKTSLDHIQVILQSEVTGDAKNHLLGLLYVNVITAVETYLSDAFITKVIEDEYWLRKFVETNPDFKKKSFNLSDLFRKRDSIEQEVKHYLLGLMWHNIAKIKQMYKDALDVTFPDDLSLIFKSIKVRHDLVHRGGKSIKDERVNITSDDLQKLTEEATTLIDSINEQLKPDNTAC